MQILHRNPIPEQQKLKRTYALGLGRGVVLGADETGTGA